MYVTFAEALRQIRAGRDPLCFMAINGYPGEGPVIIDIAEHSRLTRLVLGRSDDDDDTEPDDMLGAGG